MKSLIYGLITMAATIAACNGNKSTNIQGSNNNTDARIQAENVTPSNLTAVVEKYKVSVREVVSPYLQLKNALAKDNSSEAATIGDVLLEAFKNFDKTGLTPDQKKTFEDVEEDAREHAEHIGENKGNIEHQREHFELLSIDIYDLVKSFDAGQVLYKEFCPMYNNNKGAFWLNETKEIQNPYFGSEMPKCGSVLEELI